MRLVWSFILGTAAIVFSLAMLFEVVKINDVVKYCEAYNLMLIDDMCTEDLLNYGIGLFVGGLVVGAAGILCIASVLIAPTLPDFLGRGEGLKI